VNFRHVSGFGQAYVEEAMYAAVSRYAAPTWPVMAAQILHADRALARCAMDGSRFDRLTRSFVVARSRRSLVRVLAGAVAGLVGYQEAAARCKRDGAQCGFNSECCSSRCESWDGQSGNRCPKYQTCYCRGNGDWGTQCDEAIDCERQYETEVWQCERGWCTFKCGTGVCHAGQVCLNQGDGLRCWSRCDNEGGPCFVGYSIEWNPAGQCKAGVCYPTPYIGKACHYYGPPCPGGSHCTASAGKWGVCACPEGESVCGNGADAQCRNLNNDKRNCRTCGNACPRSKSVVCRNGGCACKKQALTLCGSGSEARCRNLRSDSNNCGTCGRACAGTQVCQDHHCCTPDGTACPVDCGPGGICKGCCTSVCDMDGQCGAIAEGTCVATEEACPHGCAPGARCPGCCEHTCDSAGRCSAHGCASGTEPCDETIPCCSTGPGDFDGAYVCKNNGGPTTVCWWD
jgi:hypothetical protein